MRGITLRHGSTGAAVLQLQQLLNKAIQHRPPLRLDGYYGQQTEAAVRFYQTSVGLRVDGVAGPDTWRALENGLVGHQRPPLHGAKGSSTVPWMAAAVRAVEGVTEGAEHLYHGAARLVTMGKTAGPPAIPQTSTTPGVKHPDREPGNASWMAIAIGEIGQKEIEGPADNSRILEYHAATTLRARSEKTPWCSSFVNWCLQQAGIRGTKSAAAISWIHWGKPSAARPGAITVIYNPRAAGSRLTASGYHVGFLLEEGPSYYNLLGGNQQDSVTQWKFSKACNRLVACRWPNP